MTFQNLKLCLRKIGTSSIEIPDNLYHTLKVKIPSFEYRLPIKDYPKSDIEFLEVVDDELKNNDFCLQNPEYHSPKFWGFIPANITGTLYYAKREKKGLIGDIKWGFFKIINEFN